MDQIDQAIKALFIVVSAGVLVFIGAFEGARREAKRWVDAGATPKRTKRNAPVKSG